MADQDISQQRYPFELPPLEYDFDALEPVIDAKTMELHHDKHHQAYVDNLNKALADHTDLHEKTLSELLSNLDSVPEAIRGAVRNNGGGHANHAMFWKLMKANGGNPAGALGEAINRDFGSFEDFKTKFNEAGVKQFGSGWVFVYDNGGKLVIESKPNQDTTLHNGVEPIMGNDVWEHAYYLKYNNRRPDYLKAWWDVVDWEAVAQRYENLRNQNA